MSQKNREQAVVRAYANQDSLDLVSDDDWDEYEARVLQGSSSGTTLTSPERTAPSPSKPNLHKRKRGATSTSSEPTDSSARATKRSRLSDDDGKSGKRFETEAGSQTDPIDVGVPKDITVDEADDSRHSTHVDQARVGLSGRDSFSPKPVEIHVSATLSRLSGGKKTTLSKRGHGGASVDVTDTDTDTDTPQTSLTGSAQTQPPKRSPVPVKETDGVEGDVPLAARPAKPKGKPTAGGSKLVKPEKEKKKTKKQIEAEKKALDLREKKMTRGEFIQYLYEEKLKEELENAPSKRLVLKDKIIWYAEPGSAKASDSFDRQRYEMVCVPCSLLVLSASRL